MANDDTYKRGSVSVLEVVHEEDDRAYTDGPDGVEYIHAAGYAPGTRLAALPHQCDAWTIGDNKKVMELIADLTAVLAKL